MSNADPELFKISEKDDLLLIVPRPDMSNDNMGWSPENVWYRSRIETKGGKTVSQGYGKFWNIDCGPEFAKVTINNVLENIKVGSKIIATLKVDGSLLIRSVYKDRVILRTRGSFGYEHHEATAAEMEVFKQRYPRMFDTLLYNERIHLLFEWVTPANKIVIHYNAPELFLLGAIRENHGGVKQYLTMEELKPIAADLGIQLVEYFEINSVGDWYNFYHTTINHREIEGYVLRLYGEQRLVKVKASLYLAKHALKAELSFRKLIELWIQAGCKDNHDSILMQLQKLYDEETVMWALPYVVQLDEAIRSWHKTKNEVQARVDACQDWTRKDFALDMQKVYASDKLLFSLAMTLFTGGEVSSNTIRNYMERFEDLTKEMKE
jgi:T4 RnlA family RNA ligase